MLKFLVGTMLIFSPFIRDQDSFFLYGNTIKRGMTQQGLLLLAAKQVSKYTRIAFYPFLNKH